MVRKIVLSLAAVLSVVGMALAQNKQVSGTVTDTKGAPVIGATVVVDGTTIGTSTDAQGQYTLNAPADGVLAVSSIGYSEQKVAINGKTVINVVLEEAAQALDDVIVTAYGEAKKEAFTGSAVMAGDLFPEQYSLLFAPYYTALFFFFKSCNSSPEAFPCRTVSCLQGQNSQNRLSSTFRMERIAGWVI